MDGSVPQQRMSWRHFSVTQVTSVVERSHARLCAVLVLLSLVCFVPGFTSLQPMDRDEPRYAQASKQMLETGDFVDIRFQDEARHKKPVGIYWLQSASVAIGEIDQARTGLDEDLPLGDAFCGAVPELNPAEARTLLAKFGLKADQVSSAVGRLSPGERTRAALALLQARGVNLLVLDEPTNHLDLPAIEQLEEALESYDGALLLVSHDRRLLGNVRLDQRWHVVDGVPSVL